MNARIAPHGQAVQPRSAERANRTPKSNPEKLMTISAPKTSKSFRERDHRFTALPVKDVLKIRLKDLGIKNVELAHSLGYPNGNVIAMMKGGSMRLPANKASMAAKMLQVDPLFLLGKIVTERDPDLWDAISALSGTCLVTANELALITLVRSQLDGHDVNLAETPEFTQAVMPVLKAVLQRENTLAVAAIRRVD